jgi:rhamnogalacturonan endolyase
MLFTLMIGIFVLSFFLVPVLGVEKLGRGLVALEIEDGSIFLSWRLLDTDPEDIAFEIKRRSLSQADGRGIDLTGGKPYRPTNFADKTLGKDTIGKNYIYELYKAGNKTNSTKSERLDRVSITPAGKGKPYISIALNGDYDFQKVGIADLDGDGAYEYIIKQPNFNTDPYQHPGYWKRSTTTYKIEAYRLDGTMLWRYDMGWPIEAGIWYSPWIVYDVDGGGRAEVYCKAGEGDPRDEKGLVQSGAEYLVKLDGETGKVVAQTDWLSRDGFLQYSRYCRNFLTVAYLDGKSPSLIIQRGTYNLIKTKALDKDFNGIWYWESPFRKENVRRLGSHGLICADVDEDGRDELVIGGAVIDDDGKTL